jgi:hypothetical protein
MIAYSFLQYRRLKIARREKKNQRAAAATNLAGCASGHHRTHRSTTAAAMPPLPKMDMHRDSARLRAGVAVGWVITAVLIDQFDTVTRPQSLTLVSPIAATPYAAFLSPQYF